MADDAGGRARRAQMYGVNDLSSSSLFGGNYINFGYWEGISLRPPIPASARIASQENMYRRVLTDLPLTPGAVCLEVGCGLAAGAAFALRHFEPAEIHCVDESEMQVERARRLHAALLAQPAPKLVVRRQSAQALTYENGTFDALYSIEAAQHFGDLAPFSSEMLRVLKPRGRLAVASFFLCPDVASAEVLPLLDTVRSGIDVLWTIDRFCAVLERAGFTDVEPRSLGPWVWNGFDAWIAQTEHATTWSRNWLRCYRSGLLDYYVVTAAAPHSPPDA